MSGLTLNHLPLPIPILQSQPQHGLPNHPPRAPPPRNPPTLPLLPALPHLFPILGVFLNTKKPHLLSRNTPHTNKSPHHPNRNNPSPPPTPHPPTPLGHPVLHPHRISHRDIRVPAAERKSAPDIRASTQRRQGADDAGRDFDGRDANGGRREEIMWK